MSNRAATAACEADGFLVPVAAGTVPVCARVVAAKHAQAQKVAAPHFTKLRIKKL
jgi:hypothetical protein